MRLVVVVDAESMRGIEAALGPTERLADGGGSVSADVAVVDLERVDRLEGILPPEAPVVWLVPPGVAPGRLRELAAARPCQIVYRPADPETVLRAARSLARRQSVTGDRAVAEDMQAGLARLWERFRGTMLERLDAVDRTAADLLEGAPDPARLAEAIAAAHKLHGSMGTFGRNRGSRLAADLESLLEEIERSPGTDPQRILRVAELAVSLRHEVERSEPAPPESGPAGAGAGVGGSAADELGRGPPGSGPAASSGARRRVLIVEPDPGLAMELRAAAAARGMAPTAVASLAAAIDAAEADRPVGAVIEPTAGPVEDLERLVKLLALNGPRVPILFQSHAGGLPERVRAASLGARAFIEKPARPAGVMSRLLPLLGEREERPQTVLTVDDDPAILEAVRSTLEPAGLQVRTLDDPFDFLQTLEQVRPDLLLLDIEMPGISGLELCRVVRLDPGWAHLPVVFLTALKDRHSLRRGFATGADDFIQKPIDGSELVSRVRHRLDRARAGQEGVDRSTRLPDRTAAQRLIQLQLALSRRHAAPVSVAAVHPTAVGALPGLASRLQARLDPADVIGRWGSDTLIVSRYGQDAAQLAAWLEPLLRGDPPGAAGVVELDSAAGLEEAVEAARSAGEIARGAGEVVRSSTGEEPAHRVDVLVVEDDEALGALLVRALEGRGHATRWVRDGAVAESLLTGDRPLRTALVILDVGLPGLDGLTLLRRLARHGLLARTRVLMLTARSAESEVMKALELGAHDHMAKPFSVSDLLHRVGRILHGPGTP